MEIIVYIETIESNDTINHVQFHLEDLAYQKLLKSVVFATE